jgi:hypothetical protein
MNLHDACPPCNRDCRDCRDCRDGRDCPNNAGPDRRLVRDVLAMVLWPLCFVGLLEVVGWVWRALA